MRALVVPFLLGLAGCIIDNDRVRVDNFTPDTAGTFTYSAKTNTVMTARRNRSVVTGSPRRSPPTGCAWPVT